MCVCQILRSVTFKIPFIYKIMMFSRTNNDVGLQVSEAKVIITNIFQIFITSQCQYFDMQ